MQYRKCVALLAVLLVGFGVVAVNDANAATVASVTITTPADSGALRGIDSTFVVQVKTRDFTPIDSLECIIYLVTSNDCTVVLDDVNTANFGAMDQISTIIMARGGAIYGSPGGATDTSSDFLTSASGAVESGGTNASIVAVKAFKGLGATTGLVGDADSVVTATSGDTTTFTWYGKVSHTSGTVSGVRAAAFVIDDATNNQPVAATADTSAIVVSSSSLTFTIDADRPANPAEMIQGADFQVAGKGPATVTGLGTGVPDAAILGIGDTIIVRAKLGNQTDPVLGSDSLIVIADVHGRVTEFSKSTRSADTLKQTIILAAGMYDDALVGSKNTAGQTDVIGVFIVDEAGNRSGTTDAAATGVTVAADFYIDVVAPVLDGEIVSGDTILPVANDTITDGGLNSGGIIDDLRPITYYLAETLDTLLITIGDGPTMRVPNGEVSLEDTILSEGITFTVDFTEIGDSLSSTRTFQVSGGGNTGIYTLDTTGAYADSVIETGVHTITFQGYDMAGNKGPVLSRSGVYIDVDDVHLARLFPTSASALDTLEEETAKVIFALSEAADSVLIRYTGIAGTDNGNSRTRQLISDELTAVGSEETYTVDSLASGTQYVLQIIAADLAGNYTITDPDTFVYDTAFVVPVIAKFAIAASQEGLGAPVDAGDDVTLTITAQTVDDAAAVTYKEVAKLFVTAGTGVTLSGTGVTDLGNGMATLSADDWVVGARTVTLNDTSSADTLSVAVSDCTDTTDLYVGSLDSVIVIQADARTQIIATVDDTAGMGDAFWVGLTYADQYGNVRVTDDGYVGVSANQLGLEIPVGDVPMVDGVGGFWAKSTSYAGADLVLTVRDLTTPTLSIVDTMVICGDGATVLDAPATVLAQDYMGADGAGDQGGFITLTFTPSADHATLTGYRIYREIAVFSGYDTGGNLVELSEPVDAMIPWGIVDAIPGADPVRVVVATLDGDSTVYGVAAERGALTTAKSAFDGAESIATPYEMLAETMQQSRQAVTDGPVFASLTPEALAFSANGIVPRMKLVDGVEQSSITRTASAVRSVDNIAPEAVAFLQTMDTPNDAGSSISVTWTKSASDQMVTQVVPQAIGGSNVYTTAGVEGYSVYRKVGDAAYTLVGSVDAGETSFVDETAFNGVRYTYQVQTFDADNMTASVTEKSAMAIRNNVVDINGAPVLGLFGVDNKVDYDDFFIFADNFGLSAGDDAFEPAFDLVADNTIDLDDFFAFADNFGKEIVATGKVVPMMAGLNSDARFYLDAGSDLPRVGEELTIDVNLENFIELQGYGFGLNYDATVLEFVGARVENNILGEGQLAQPQAIAQSEGSVSIAAFGDVATKGDLGLSLVFRAVEEIEASYIEITEGALQDASYGLNSVTGPVSVRIETRPEVYALSDNYPNPFNPETTIKYQLPEAGDVTLEVYNMLGQVVRTLVNEQQGAGRYVYQWDASNDAGQALSSGIYFYRIQAGGEFQSVKKMLLLK